MLSGSYFCSNLPISHFFYSIDLHRMSTFEPVSVFDNFVSRHFSPSYLTFMSTNLDNSLMIPFNLDTLKKQILQMRAEKV